MSDTDPVDGNATRQSTKRGKRKLGLFLVFLVLSPIILVLSPFYIAVVLITEALKERTFRRRLRERGRFIEWKQLELKLRAGEGTLVVEQGQKRPIRVWWTLVSICGQFREKYRYVPLNI